MSEPKRTPLAALHEARGGRMVEFAGFWMPVQYTGIKQEHAAVREAAGLFDVSHMGQIALQGSGAARAADRLLSRRVSDLAPGRVRYALLCNDAGGVVDDLTAYRRAEDDVMLCVNAANIEKDLAWIEAHVGEVATVRDESSDTGLLALQGPKSAAVLERLGCDTTALRRFRFAETSLAELPVLLSRTGYTGAEGFEIYCRAGDAPKLFEALLATASDTGLTLAGLGARDTLRLEAALPLYGHELDDARSPLDAGLGRFVDLEDHDFIGAEAIRAHAEEQPESILVGFELTDRGVAREGYPVEWDGEPLGEVTSGGPSPTLGKSIGLAYVTPSHAGIGTPLDILIRGRATRARVVETPFVSGGAAGRPQN
jgi:aminomethyltransferase